MGYGDFKDLTRRRFSDKIFCDKAFNTAKNPKHDGYQRGLASMVYKYFEHKSALLARSKTLRSRTVATQAMWDKFASSIKNEDISSKELAEELRKSIIRKSKKRKVHSPFIDNIRSADLADMKLVSKFNNGFRFLLCVIDIFSKNAWAIPLKDKKDTTITNAFQKFLDESNCKLNKI